MLAGAMLAGALTNVMAYDYEEIRTYELITGVYATYALRCNMSDGYSEASTSVIADYEADEIRVSASVEADGLYGGVIRETIGSDYEERITYSGYEADVVVAVENSVDVYYLELTVVSTQTAHFDDGIDRRSHVEEFSVVLD